MNDLVIHSIELFAGVGMLGEGLRAGLAHMGIKTRTVCFVEREAYAASVLVARMEEGSLDAAPIWSDICTFDASAWHGKVDCVVAGFPCQDLSIAGRRAGLDGKRSGLFFEAVRVAADCGAWFMLLENVAGIATATASVVDETEGELDERAAARVVGELADLGWDSEWIVISASDVGASHGRARWFCLAWRMDNTDSAGTQRPRRAQSSVDTGCESVGDSRLQYGDLQQRKIRAEHPRTSGSMDDAECAERRSKCVGGVGRNEGIDGRRTKENCGSGISSQALAHSSSTGFPQRDGGGGICERSFESIQRTDIELHRNALFAPSPNDKRWGEIISKSPWLSPALSIEQELDAKAAFTTAQSVFCGMADGVAEELDFNNRAARLKCCGNGVVPLSAALALVILARRAGIFE